MDYFEKAFYRSLQEDNAAGAGGVFGDAGSMGYGGALTPAGDFYASGDARNIFGGVATDKKKGGKKKKKKQDKKNHLQPLMPMQRRNLNNSM